jgi:RNA polymerase sigma-70 factor (ECF subfamily)
MAAANSAGELPISDEKLIERVRRDDHSAFDLLYERYFPRVCGYVRRRLHNPADVEETVQEVFINVFTSLDSFRGEAPFAAWVLGVSRCTIASRFKKKRHLTVPLEDAQGDEQNAHTPSALRWEPTPLEHYECAERIAQIETTVREKLSKDQWQLIDLHHLKHRSVREIARVLNRSEDAVKSNLYRARKLLLAR